MRASLEIARSYVIVTPPLFPLALNKISSMKLHNTTFVDNSILAVNKEATGGAMFCLNTPMYATDTLFEANTARSFGQYAGGGAVAFATDNLVDLNVTLVRTEFDSNEVLTSGSF